MIEHFDALGYDYSFLRWYRELRTIAQAYRFLSLDSFEVLKDRLICKYICKPHILLGHGPNCFQTCILFTSLHLLYGSAALMSYKWNEAKVFLMKSFSLVCPMFLNQMPSNTLVLEP